MTEYKNPSIATSILIEKNENILLIKRNTEPFKGNLALPGGFVDYGERVEDAAVREIKEETGLDVKLKDILAINSDRNRDPRGHVIDVVFIGEIIGGEIKISNESKEVKWFTLNELIGKKFAFDHAKVIEYYKKWKKVGGTYWSTK